VGEPQSEGERNLQVIRPAKEVQAKKSHEGFKLVRWLHLHIRDDEKQVIRFTVPWFLCGWLITFAIWTLRFVPQADKAINDNVPGGIKAVQKFMLSMRYMPAGARIEVHSDSDYVLIECR